MLNEIKGLPFIISLMNGTCILCRGKQYQELHNINGYKIVRCEKCSLVFIVPWPDKKDLEKIYKNYHYKDGFLHENEIRRDARRTLGNLEKLGYKNNNLLDVGCGAGFFLDEARKKCWNTMGVDTGSTPVDYATSKLNLNVIRKDIQTFHSKKRFKFITLLQLIEHLVNPYPTLSKVKSLLEDDGIVCIATPNINSILYKVFKDRFQHLLPPEHVIYYSPATLKRVLENAGFKVVKIITYSYAEDMGGIYRHFRRKLEKTNAANSNSETNSHQLNKKSKKSNYSRIKQFKSFLFENVIREFSYPLLNIGLHGSIIEIYVKKGNE